MTPELRSLRICGLPVDLVGYEGFDGDTVGEWRPRECEIRLRPSVAAPMQRVALCRAIVEAWSEQSGLDLSPSQITALGTALHQLLMENPRLQTVFLSHEKVLP